MPEETHSIMLMIIYMKGQVSTPKDIEAPVKVDPIEPTAYMGTFGNPLGANYLASLSAIERTK